MKNVTYLTVLICLIVMVSCGKQKKSVSGNFGSGFPAPVKLKGTRIFKNEIGITSFLKVDSFFVVTSGQKRFIHVYNRQHQLIARFGRIGKGPGEFLRAPRFKDFVSTDSTIYLFHLEYNRLKYLKIDLLASIRANKTVVDTVYKLPQKLMSATSMYYINNSMLAGYYSDTYYKLIDGKRGLFYYNLNTKKLKTFPQYMVNIRNEKKIGPADMMPYVNINARATDISPNRAHLAVVLFSYPRLKIFNVGSTKGTHYLLDSAPVGGLSLDRFEHRDLTIYYRGLVATNKNIYLLYSGAKMKNQSSSPKRIQVVSWQGQPEAQYIIPAKYKLATLSVDEKNNCFYGVSFLNDAIYKFNYSSTKSTK